MVDTLPSSSAHTAALDDADLDDTAAEPSIQTLPLDAWHRARGARMVPFAGYAMPIQYEGIMAEHSWTRTAAGLFDVSHMGQLLLSGDGAAEALEALVPGDITGLTDGRMRYSLLLNDEGGTLDDLMITRRADGLYLVVNGAVKWDDIAHLREHLPDTVTLNHWEDQALLALQGPQAVAAFERLVPGVAALSFMTGAAFDWAGVPLWVSRSGYTGEDGVEISIPATDVGRLAEALTQLPEVKPIGLGARDSLRLEAGLPLYGHDLAPDITPIEAGLGFAVQKRRRAEGGFPGDRTILAQIADGPARLRVGLLLDGRQPAREGATVLADGKPVGVVTSGGFAPTVGAPIALALIEAGLAAPGTALTLEVRGKPLAARVVPLPFVPHRYHRTSKKGVA